jgi:hypothetical protein
MNIRNIKPGDRVHFFTEELGHEDGIVKSVSPSAPIVFVVYNCGGKWWEYQDYTPEATHVEDLRPGWVAEKLEDPEPYSSVMHDTQEESDERNYGIEDSFREE